MLQTFGEEIFTYRLKIIRDLTSISEMIAHQGDTISRNF